LGAFQLLIKTQQEIEIYWVETSYQYQNTQLSVFLATNPTFSPSSSISYTLSFTNFQNLKLSFLFNIFSWLDVIK